MGPAVLRFSHIREATVPRREGVRRILPALADKTGETAHASILQGSTLVTLAAHASVQHTARVVLDETDLPLHATASGLAVLAFAAEPLKEVAYRNLEKFTEHTVTDIRALDQILSNIKKSGFGESLQSFEEGVSGIAVPLFDSSNEVAGSIAVASVTSRVTDDLVSLIKRELVNAARSVSLSWGGTIPRKLDKIWAPYS